MKKHTAEEARLKRDALRIFRASVKAANAEDAVHECVRRTGRSGSRLTIEGRKFELREFHRVVVLAIGKAAVPMASALEGILGGDLDEAMVVTTYGHAGRALRRCTPIEAGHPIPDQAGEQAARAVETMLRELTARDLLIVALSGGASALLPAPAGKVTLEAKQKTTDRLLRAGATIHQMNTVRKHLSRLKGGGVARLAYPATVETLALSDVVGDSFEVIGSGPTAPDASTFADACGVLKELGLWGRTPRRVREHLELGMSGAIAETPKMGSEIFSRVHHVLVGSNGQALHAARAEAQRLGYRTLVLSSSIEGETREVAGVHAQILREITKSGQPLRAPACVLSGGETTVTLRGMGKGGRNQEFVLAAALQISGQAGVAVMSAGTDGTDGPTDAAGAFTTGSSVERARQLGLDPAAELAQNNSYEVFDRLGDLIRTGPTGTNVMDVHVMLAIPVAKVAADQER